MSEPFVIEIVLRNADVALVERVIAVAHHEAGSHWSGVSFGNPLFQVEAKD